MYRTCNTIGTHKSKIKNDTYYTTLGPRCQRATKKIQNQDSMKWKQCAKTSGMCSIHTTKNLLDITKVLEIIPI
jgi:hypothetical protein